jgi:hypothetical protein
MSALATFLLLGHHDIKPAEADALLIFNSLHLRLIIPAMRPQVFR